MDSPNTMHENAFAIAIDWLQLYCFTDSPDIENFTPIFPSVYKIVKQDYSTRQFQNVYEVFCPNPTASIVPDSEVESNCTYHYCTILSKPFSNVIDNRGVLVKLSNRELYQPDFTHRMVEFLALYGLKFRSISRIDLCYDCNELAGNMSPRKFINGFISGKYLKNNQPSYTLQCDTQGDKREYLVDAICDQIEKERPKGKAATKEAVRRAVYKTIERSDSSKVRIRGNAKHVRDINYVGFGSHASGVCSYIYNKTKELREVKDKPYIRQLWRLNGIDETREVWRIELSIKSDRKTLLEKDTGEVFAISTDMLKFQKDIEELFYTYAAKYFNFKINDNKANKSRMHDLVIFERQPQVTKRPVTLTLQQDAQRSDKTFIKKLIKLKYEMPYKTSEYSYALHLVTMEFCLNKHVARAAHRAELECRQKYGIMT